MIEHAQRGIRLDPVAAARRTQVLIALTLLGVAMTTTAVLEPEVGRLIGGTDQPGFGVIAGVGVVMIGLSSLFLAAVGNVVGLRLATLCLALLSNALVLVAGFVLTPEAFYQTTFFDSGGPDFSTPGFLPWVAVASLLVLALGPAILYLIFRTGVAVALHRRWWVPLLAVPLVMIWCLLALFYSGLEFLGFWPMWPSLAARGAALFLLLALMAWTGVAWETARTSVAVGRVGMLTGVLWLSLSLLLLYHVVWVVFMTALIGIWPLKVIAGDGK